ncbi:MAG: hypothetical protein ABFC62_08930 [Clostridiaceae bacterium]
MEFIIIAVVLWAIISALTKNRNAGTKNANEKTAAQSYADQDRSPQVHAAQMRAQQLARPAQPRQSPPLQSYAPKNRAVSEQEAMWGTPSYSPPARSPEGGPADGDPFCQGPAGSFVSSEGVGDFEGRGGLEGAGAPGGEGYSAPGMLGTRGTFVSPHLSVVQSKIFARDAAEAQHPEAASRIQLSFDREAAMRGLLYAEVLGKPKALRR